MIGTDIAKSIAALKDGELIGFPTETVYGLAANALKVDAVKKIYQLKNRPASNPLILHVDSLEAAKKFTTAIVPNAVKLAETFWPGPLTLLLPKRALIPDIVTAGTDKVAIRVPRHPLALTLLTSLDFPIVAPSANPFTSISPTNAKMVWDYFGEQVPYILDGGDCMSGIESTIVGFEGNAPIIYRQGAISIEAIELVVGKVQFKNTKVQHLVTPGMAKIHYAPRTRMCIIEDILDFIYQYPASKIGFIGMGDKHLCHPNLHYVSISPTCDLEEACKNLYSCMYELDKLNLDFIVIKQFPDFGLGKSLNDRINRAAANFVGLT